MNHLILLFSGVGNVAMSLPIVESVAGLQPADHFVFVSARRLSDMFFAIPNLDFLETEGYADDKPNKSSDAHRAMKSVFRLFEELKSRYAPFDDVIDLQNDSRSRMLCRLLRFRGVRVYRVKRLRWRKLRLKQRGYYRSEPLPSLFELYRQVFAEASLKSDTQFVSLPARRDIEQHLFQLYGRHETGVASAEREVWIGIAPFAKSKTNMLPYRKTKQILDVLSARTNVKLFLFGAGKAECEMLEQWAGLYPKTISVAGKLSLAEELELIRHLDVMLGMDSANQHLSSLMGREVVTVWCGTHTHTGYYGWKQDESNKIELPLSCRPCTNHGRNYCVYGNFRCQEIEVDDIIAKIDTLLSKQLNIEHIKH